MASLEPSGDGFVVNFAFGRRGTTLQTGTKTAAPVDYGAALAVYEKLVGAKKAKGYTPGPDGTPYQGTEREAAATGVLPQLLNAIDEGQASLLVENDDWWMQEKFDGRRILIRRDGDEVIGINRKGLAVALPQTTADAAQAIGDGRQWLMDGEAIADTYVTFDLLEQNGADLRKEPYRRRLEALSRLLESKDRGPIRIARTACSTSVKRDLLAQVRRYSGEGVVFKRAAAPYTPGRPASNGDQLKLKFTATASCIVARTNGTKRSVSLALLDGGRRVAVGNVTIPVNQPLPRADSVVEVRYLYAYPGGSLFQPVYAGTRDDIGAEVCTVAQLRFKAGELESEESEP
jgi:bifunctional non-homologous end joining protein LigD